MKQMKMMVKYDGDGLCAGETVMEFEMKSLNNSEI